MQILKKKSFLEKNGAVIAFIFFGYFLFRIFYLASTVSHHIPPDEITRFGICKIFSKVLLLPQNSEESYSLGLVTHVPYLYYFIMGKLLKLNFLPMSDLVFLRFLNCILCFTTVIYGYKWIKLLTNNIFCHILFVIFFTNTSMFSFIGSAVTYDNLVNVCAAAALYYMHLFFRKHDARHFLLCGIFILGGCLTKISFLPLALILPAVFLFHERKHLKNMFDIIRKGVAAPGLSGKFLLFIFIVMLILNSSLYVGNLIRFKKIVPLPNQVLSGQQCMQDRLYARTLIVGFYKSGRITVEEAEKMILRIPHKGDQKGTRALLQIAVMEKQRGQRRIDRFHYAFIWTDQMTRKIIGIMAHKNLYKSSMLMLPYYGILILSVVFIIRKFQIDDFNGFGGHSIFIVLAYSLILMQWVNYNTYFEFGVVDFAMQGRYLFPVLIPLYGLIAVSFTSYIPEKWQVVIGIFTSVLFIYGDFPWFLIHASKEWFF